MEITHDDLVCKVCKEFSASPIHVCINGHTGCGVCIEKIKKCTICQNDLSPFLMAEKVFYKKAMRLACKYLEVGCTERVKASDMKEHVFSACKFRPKNEIPEVLSQNGEFEVNHSYPSLETNHARSFLAIKFNRCKFFYHSALEDGVFYFWLSVIGNKALAGQYKLVLNFPFEVPPNGKSIRDTATSTLPVVAFEDSELIKVQGTGKAAAIPVNVLAPFFLEVEEPMDDGMMEKKLIKYTLENTHKIAKHDRYKLRSSIG